MAKPVQLKVNSKIAGYSLRLNPVADELLLANGNKTKVLQLQVTVRSGRILQDRVTKSTDAVIRTDVGRLQEGYYFLSFKSTNGDITIPWIQQ